MNNRLNRAPIESWPSLAIEAQWKVSVLAGLLGVSTRTLERRFKEKIGKSPRAWLTEQKQLHTAKLLQHAITLLGDGLSVKEVSSQLGYAHRSQFSREFKQHFGLAPTDDMSPLSQCHQLS